MPITRSWQRDVDVAARVPFAPLDYQIAVKEILVARGLRFDVSTLDAVELRQMDYAYHAGLAPEQFVARLCPRHADALRDAALQLEHQAEFNMSETDGWTDAERVENNRLINQSRELHDRADAAERASRTSERVA